MRNSLKPDNNFNSKLEMNENVQKLLEINGIIKIKLIEKNKPNLKNSSNFNPGFKKFSMKNSPVNKFVKSARKINMVGKCNYYYY